MKRDDVYFQKRKRGTFFAHSLLALMSEAYRERVFALSRYASDIKARSEWPGECRGTAEDITEQRHLLFPCRIPPVKTPNGEAPLSHYGRFHYLTICHYQYRHLIRQTPM
ncbi:hypothetical protein F2P81_017089 [Scophthalmus maximus]|uniref:Uncharacterized protein n=1 Tax=Scophthalmus maximus TaxID=52904 RepID=A0A6A4SDM6_SCOMX|nr:hypothetical protein F2P81_017089 [Scophthalmus maximus]